MVLRTKSDLEEADKIYVSAINDFTIAIHISDSKIGYYFTWRSRANFRRESYEMAINDATQAIEISPDDGWAYVWRGIAYASQANRLSKSRSNKKSQQLQKLANEDIKNAIKKGISPEKVNKILNRGQIYALE